MLTQGGVQQVLPGQSADRRRRRSALRRRAQRHRHRRLRHVDREPRPPLRCAAARPTTCRRRWSAPPISINTARGRRSPEYGACGTRTTCAADWAPYRNGYWADVGAWGPTWVDDAPWGYAPFHYGRWAYVGGRWGWAPGRYVARPLWAPALVGWTGGAGWGVGIAVGGAGVRMGAARVGRAYRPWWGTLLVRLLGSLQPSVRVNVGGGAPEQPAADALRQLQCAERGHGGVRAPTFAARQPVQQNLVRVSRDVVATAPVLTSASADAQRRQSRAWSAVPTRRRRRRRRSSRRWRGRRRRRAGRA